MNDKATIDNLIRNDKIIGTTYDSHRNFDISFFNEQANELCLTCSNEVNLDSFSLTRCSNSVTDIFTTDDSTALCNSGEDTPQYSTFKQSNCTFNPFDSCHKCIENCCFPKFFDKASLCNCSIDTDVINEDLNTGIPNHYNRDIFGNFMQGFEESCSCYNDKNAEYNGCCWYDLLMRTMNSLNINDSSANIHKFPTLQSLGTGSNLLVLKCEPSSSSRTVNSAESVFKELENDLEEQHYTLNNNLVVQETCEITLCNEASQDETYYYYDSDADRTPIIGIDCSASDREPILATLSHKRKHVGAEFSASSSFCFDTDLPPDSAPTSATSYSATSSRYFKSNDDDECNPSSNEECYETYGDFDDDDDYISFLEMMNSYLFLSYSNGHCVACKHHDTTKPPRLFLPIICRRTINQEEKIVLEKTCHTCLAVQPSGNKSLRFRENN